MSYEKPPNLPDLELRGQRVIGLQSQTGWWRLLEAGSGKLLKDQIGDWRDALVEMAKADDQLSGDPNGPGVFDSIAHRVFDEELASMSPVQYTQYCESRVVEFASYGEFAKI